MSFQQGLSGLNAASKNLDVIGNNVSNAQTSGFKSGQAQFADVFAASLQGSGSSPVGLGTKIAGVVQQFTQGNITSTNNPLDVAINGGGFFMVSDALGSAFYSRNGQFQQDKNGAIVTNEGFHLMGWLGDPTTGKIIQSTPTQLTIPKNPIPPNPTTAVKANLNFDAAAKIPSGITLPAGTPSTQNVTGFNYADPLTYNNTTSATVYDSTGAANSYSMYFTKVAANTWNVYSVLTNSVGDATPLGNASLTGGTATTPLITAGNLSTISTASTTGSALGGAVTIGGATGAPQLQWNQASTTTPVNTLYSTAGTASMTIAAGATVGTLTNNSYYPISNATVTDPNGHTLTNVSLRVDKNTGNVTIISQSGGPLAQDQITFGLSGTLNATGSSYNDSINSTILATGGSALSFSVAFNSSTQYSGSFGVNTLTQDGYARGLPAGFNIGSDGVITGKYTNGQTKSLGQFVLGRFPNAQGLQPVGNNLWTETSTSGQVVQGYPGSSGDFGLLQSSATEDSNVDLTAELVNMITAQRNYQANAQTIKTVDSVLQTLINLR